MKNVKERRRENRGRIQGRKRNVEGE